MSIEWLTGVSQVVGLRPDLFSCELNFIKALVYTLCEDNLVPWLRYLSVCVYMMLVALSMCLRVGVGIVWGILCSNDRNTFSSSVGMSIEWLTGVSQAVGLSPEVFSCELNLITINFFVCVNGNTEQAQCALSRVCIPYEKEKKCNEKNRICNRTPTKSRIIWRFQTPMAPKKVCRAPLGGHGPQVGNHCFTLSCRYWTSR